ncbi:redoxin domain-containing protein [Salisediminibacterium selenitireducens]|uniref:Redoxin domain-containing protein n=1 Tax=Bacillus selenitireducens (strain ATCC 700615 / DSM 15326 / MLS10) TaxID=439292 RepID=D6XWS6_BACIE|nr:redoxin domain-containing protein [Salisediminibacterium selenitireducens]ADH99902.1 redoxin domain-containing protein [[Bacillus] selenitireducens MLS10]
MKLHTPLPDFPEDLIWLNAPDNVTSASPLNRPVLIHFWSVSCTLCKKDYPELNKLREDFHDQLSMIAVHMPRQDIDYDMDEIRSAIHQHGITQPCVIDRERVLTDIFENRYVPAYYLFDASGKLRHYQAGGRATGMLRRRIMRITD